MLTAKQAAVLSGLSVEDHIKYLESKIERAAENSRRDVFVTEPPYNMWLHGKPTGVAKQVIDTLESNGYIVKGFYDRYDKYLDTALVINW